MNNADILFEALRTGVAALAIVALYRICMKLIEVNGT